MQVSFLTLVANKLKRINSTANNSITYMKKKKGISKKKIKSIRTNSSKQNKNVVKNVKYKSPQKIDFSKYTFKIKSKLEDFKKTCFSKQKTCRVSNSKDNKSKAQKLISKNKNQPIPVLNSFYPTQTIRMKTINLADSKTFDEISEIQSIFKLK